MQGILLFFAGTLQDISFLLGTCRFFFWKTLQPYLELWFLELKKKKGSDVAFEAFSSSSIWFFFWTSFFCSSVLMPLLPLLLEGGWDFWKKFPGIWWKLRMVRVCVCALVFCYGRQASIKEIEAFETFFLAENFYQIKKVSEVGLSLPLQWIGKCFLGSRIQA